MKIRLGLLASVASVLVALSVGGAEARTRALVVGVSGYPGLPEAIRLKGPKNDSREVANALVRLGVPAGDITVLADGVERLADGIAAPGLGNKAAILAELDRLADQSESGDLVVFYFSGHGAQQPDDDGDEQGGNDEIVLPYDIGSWNGDGVDKALVDDELNERVSRILDKGADFFGIIDACHSATSFRAVGGDETLSRQVDAETLGIPGAAMVEAEPRALLADVKSSTPGRGRAAFFYAAQETEKALEKVPTGAAPGESYGVFTYSLLRRLNENPNVTYRTLHQAVMADIKRNTLVATQTPELEGELLDEPALRLTNAQPIRQWKTFGGKLEAGQLEGLSVGTILGLYADPADTQDKVLAYGEVVDAGATRSLITPVTYPCESVDQSGTCATPADEAAFKKGRYARVVEPGIDLSVVLSEPLRIDPNDGFDYGPAIAALQDAVGSPDLSARVSLKKTGYDVAVALVDGKLAFAAGGGLVDPNGPGSSPRLTLPNNPQAATATVAGAVNRIAKAMALQRLGGGVEAEQALGFVSNVLVAKPKAGAPANGTCADLSDYEAPAGVGDIPELENCDVLSVSMTNQGRKPLDVTVLLVGPDFSITPLWPNEGDANRINTGETKTVDLLRKDPGDEPANEQRLIFVTVPGVGKSHVAFTNLEQEGLRAVPGEDASATAAREYVAAGLNEMSRSAATQPARIEEEMSISVKPFYVGE